MSYYTVYNRDGEKVTIMNTEDEKDSYLSLAYRELMELPRDCIARLEHIQHLDLSNNKFSDLRSLYGLSGLKSLVLDCNEVTSHTVFPTMLNLQILWLNKNNITNLSVFTETISSHFPNLRQMSMMNNPAAPSYFNGGTKQEYQDFRHYIISHLPKLEFLDDTSVSKAEREKAFKVYGRRRASNTLDRENGTPTTLRKKRSESESVKSKVKERNR